MAFSHFISFVPILISLSILYTLSSAQSADIKDTSLISQVCAKTRNPSLCNEVLSSAPGAKTANLTGLAYISINIALTNAKDTSKYVAVLVSGAKDVKLKNRYDTCAELYGDAIDDLNQSAKVLAAGDIGSLQTYASSAFDGPSTCQDGFDGPPAAPAKLTDANTKLEGLVSIILAIASSLKN